MIGLALVTALTIFASSITASLNAAIDRVIGAELIVATETQRPFPRTLANDIEGLDGVAVVSRSHVHPGPDRGRLRSRSTGSRSNPPTTFVGTVDPATIDDVINLTFSEGGLDQLTDTGVIVDTATADVLWSSRSATTSRSPLPAARATLQAGRYLRACRFLHRVLDHQPGARRRRRLHRRHVRLRQGRRGCRPRCASGRDRAGPGVLPGVIVQSQAELKEQVQSNVQALLGVMIALLGLAIVIAVLGIVNTLFLSVLERTREIGMLRAVGTSRWQVRWMVVLESVVIALFGAILGIVLGVVFATALQRTLADQGIDVLQIPIPSWSSTWSSPWSSGPWRRPGPRIGPLGSTCFERSRPSSGHQVFQDGRGRCSSASRRRAAAVPTRSGRRWVRQRRGSRPPRPR